MDGVVTLDEDRKILCPTGKDLKKGMGGWLWSLTLREESRLRVFENRILRRIFGPKRDENGEWRRLHNEELHSL